MTEDQQAPPGWYPDPEMVDTQRYWDGNQWTDHRNAKPARKPANDKMLKRVATFIGLAFLAPMIVLTAVQPSSHGVQCGTWITPEFDDLGLSMKQLTLTTSGGNAIDAALLNQIAGECQDSLATRRAIVLALLALGIACRFAIPAIVRAARD